VLQTEGPNAIGGNGGCLGYSGTPFQSNCPPSTTGITPSVAVEFYAYQNVPYDINSNHVAILTNGQLNDLDAQTPYGVTIQGVVFGPINCTAKTHVRSVEARGTPARTVPAASQSSTCFFTMQIIGPNTTC
jgi:hypothetical protein